MYDAGSSLAPRLLRIVSAALQYCCHFLANGCSACNEAQDVGVRFYTYKSPTPNCKQTYGMSHIATREQKLKVNE